MKYTMYGKNWFFGLFWFCLISCFSVIETKAQCDLDDFLALKSLYESTGGDNWTNPAFWDMVSENETPMPDCDLSFLHGISLNIDGRVNNVGLFNNNLTGELPAAIGNLTHLTSLSLTDNLLTGKLPAEIGQLINLTDLSLSNNKLSGTLPESLLNLKNIEILFLSNNQFSGVIPAGLTGLDRLSWVFLEQNQFNGNLPLGFGNLPNLTYLSLYQNQLEGDIPTDLDRLDNLKWVLLQENDLSGCFPTSLCQLELDSLNFIGNPKLPNSGDFQAIDSLCSNSSVQIGLACDDGKDNTLDDSIKEDCTCSGEFMIAVNEYNQVNPIQIFPNPVADFIYLNIPYEALEAFQIVDLAGKVVLNVTQTSPFINVQELNIGKYFLRVLHKQKKLQVIPFVKL